MKLVEFSYTKANGARSDRAVVVVAEPQPNISGIDVTQLDQDNFVAFIDEYRLAKNRHHEELMQLMQKHDLVHNYRQFVPDRMERVETTWL